MCQFEFWRDSRGGVRPARFVRRSKRNSSWAKRRYVGIGPYELPLFDLDKYVCSLVAVWIKFYFIWSVIIQNVVVFVKCLSLYV